MLTTTSPKPFLKHIDEKDQALLKHLSSLFLSKNTVFINESGEIVYQEPDQKPILGFVDIYYFAKEKGIKIFEELGENLLALEEKYKQKAKLIPELILKKALDEYESEHPNMTNVVKILSREIKPLARIERGLVYDQGVEHSDFVELLDQNPDFLTCYIDAVTHPKLGELIRHIKLLQGVLVNDPSFSAVIQDIEAKDHDELISIIKNRLIQFIESNSLLNSIAHHIDRLFSCLVDAEKNFNELIKMIKQVGKICIENAGLAENLYEIRVHNAPYTVKQVIENALERHKIKFEQKIAVLKVKETLDAQPDYVPPASTQDDLVEKRLASLNDTVNQDNLYLLNQLLCRIEDKKSKLRKEEIALVIKLMSIIDAESLNNYKTPVYVYKGKPFRELESYTTPLIRAVNIGDVELFNVIWKKIQTVSNAPSLDEIVIEIAGSKIPDDVKKVRLQFLFEQGASVPETVLEPAPKKEAALKSARKEALTKPISEEPYFDLIKQASADRIKSEEKALDACLTRDPIGIILNYCWPVECVSAVRQGFFTRTPRSADDAVVPKATVTLDRQRPAID